MVYGDSEVKVFALPVHGWWLVWASVSCFIQLARWSSEAVLSYVAEPLLQVMSDAYRNGLSLSALGTSAEETPRQLEVVKSETVQDKRLIRYLQQEVAKLKAIEVVKVMDLGIL